MKYEPRQHQRIAAEFLKTHDHCALLLDMGLGKTVITLTEIDRLIYHEFAINKVLVIAPLAVAYNTWTTEAEAWDHLSNLRVIRVLGTAAQRRAALKQDADVYVINRENVVWLVTEFIESKKKWPFDMLVIDELSSFKNSRSKRFRALRKVAGLSKRVIGLTGTPVPNSYIDLWSQIYLIDGGVRLGRTIGAYRDSYFKPGARNGAIVYEWILKPHAKEWIDQQLKPICLSMSKEDWLDMPPITYNNRYVFLDKKERELYETMKRDHVIPILDKQMKSKLKPGDDYDAVVLAPNAATVAGKLLQMANGAVYFEDVIDGENTPRSRIVKEVVHVHDRKLDELADIVEASNGQPLLVFYNYRHDIDRIKDRFPQAVEFAGKPEQVTKWNNSEYEMMLAHPASVSFGLNLQHGGHIVVWFGLPWSLEQYAQANARLYRQGQERTVIVHHIIAKNTIDEQVLQALHSKDKTQNALLSALKDYLGEEVQPHARE